MEARTNLSPSIQVAKDLATDANLNARLLSAVSPWRLPQSPVLS